MNLKKLRAALPEAYVQPKGKVLERIKARVTGEAPAVDVHLRGHRFSMDSSWTDEAAAAAYLRSKIPMEMGRPQ